MMQQEIHYALIEPQNLDSAWQVAAPWLMQAIGTDSEWGQIEEIRKSLYRKDAHLWLFQEKPSGRVLVTFVTERAMVGGLPTLIIRWLGGKSPEEWIYHIGVVESWARENGFKKVEAWGRPGWSKLLQPHGYRESFRVLEKLIDRGIH